MRGRGSRPTAAEADPSSGRGLGGVASNARDGETEDVNYGAPVPPMSATTSPDLLSRAHCERWCEVCP